MTQQARTNGIYYTALSNPFRYRVFRHWAGACRLKDQTVLEPFAGANDIVHMLHHAGFGVRYASYDLFPKHKGVQPRDTLKHFPKGYTVCITNPPWLYKSRASRLHLPFPKTTYDDLYKHCLSLCLQHGRHVAALIPASYMQSGLFVDRLYAVVLIHERLFEDTDNPVCLALFNDRRDNDPKVYYDDTYIGTMQSLYRHMPRGQELAIRFNSPEGEWGLVCIDGLKEASIRFCNGRALRRYSIRHSSRSITRISGVRYTKALDDTLNKCIKDFRDKTNDFFLTPFKGLRADGSYRRRMEYAMARKIMSHVCS